MAPIGPWCTAAAVLIVALVLVSCDSGTSGGAAMPSPTVPGWADLDPQARCERAAALVTHPDRWPMACRWRAPGETLGGQAYPPPPGPPPFDNPRIEIYVAPDQTPEELAHAIAHELGHMHHTRDARFVADWLAARRLPAPDTTGIWTEDYAEVFAALFSPPSPAWRAPTARPGPQELADLRQRFFA